LEREKSKSEIISLSSNLLGREVQYCAILPKGYQSSGHKFPVLYLLHGLFGRFDNWIMNTRIIEYAQDFPLLIVCPEGGDGWYSDSENLRNHFYESYIFRELIPDVERRFNVDAARKSRAIAGLSMGGYGALKFAFRRPEMFCFAASMSGAFHAATIFDDQENEPWKELQPSILNVFGVEGKKKRAENDLLRMVSNFPAERIPELPFFYFDCGTEDSFLPINEKLDKIFSGRKIAHEFRQFPGEHDWNYWDKRIIHILQLAASKLLS
jgi:putative tributyrin esterase